MKIFELHTVCSEINVEKSIQNIILEKYLANCNAVRLINDTSKVSKIEEDIMMTNCFKLISIEYLMFSTLRRNVTSRFRRHATKEMLFEFNFQISLKSNFIENRGIIFKQTIQEHNDTQFDKKSTMMSGVRNFIPKFLQICIVSSNDDADYEYINITTTTKETAEKLFVKYNLVAVDFKSKEVNALKLRKKLKFSSLMKVSSTSIAEQIFQQTIPEHNDFELHEKSKVKYSMMTSFLQEILGFFPVLPVFPVRLKIPGLFPVAMNPVVQQNGRSGVAATSIDDKKGGAQVNFDPNRVKIEASDSIDELVVLKK
uniref:Uncharacterized protein n=1 Tax=Romanomermis culicivorax TaxID=13658 RepID=A0A915L4S3_ROMCU